MLGVRSTDLHRLRDVRPRRPALPRPRRCRAATPRASSSGPSAPSADDRHPIDGRHRHEDPRRRERRRLPDHGRAGHRPERSGGPLFSRWALFGPLVAHGDWWRLITSAFLHASVLHIAFNMLALWWLGSPVELALGRARYLGLYIVSGLAGSAGALLADPHSVTVGASGAIFGLLGAGLILEWQATGSLAGNYLMLIVINLAISFAVPGISYGGHIGGLVGGIVTTLRVHARRPPADCLRRDRNHGGRHAPDRRRFERAGRVLESSRPRVVASGGCAGPLPSSSSRSSSSRRERPPDRRSCSGSQGTSTISRS